MYTFPDTGGEVISSFALVAIFVSIVTAKAPYQLTQVQRLECLVVMPILTCKWDFYHSHLSLCNRIYSVMIELFRYRIRKNERFTLIYIISLESVYYSLEVVSEKEFSGSLQLNCRFPMSCATVAR